MEWFLLCKCKMELVMRKFLLIGALFAIFTACKQESNALLPVSNGQINSVAIVIDNQLWNGAVGDTLRNYFAQPLEGIPGVQEPIFYIHQLPPSIFKGNTRNSRNILIVDTDSKNRVDLRDTLFAKPQKVAYIIGQTTDDIITQIQQYAPQIISVFKDNEIKESQARFKNSLNASVDDISKKLGIKIMLPSIYSMVKQENNFFWIERRLKGGTANIIMYEMPLESIPVDEAARNEAIIKMRDSIGERYIPGREEGMYMVTGTAFAPSVYDVVINGKPAIESRGLWEIKNFLLGGPFVNYIIEDKINNRYVVLEGFISAPGVSKRDYLFELEAIIKTIQFVKK